MHRDNAACDLADIMEGYLYVLFDAYSGRCKIGRTRQMAGKLQRSIMSAYPVPTLNAVTACVADCVAAETQCHRYFASLRANGEWFDIGVVEAVQYVHEEIDWCELDRRASWGRGSVDPLDVRKAHVSV